MNSPSRLEETPEPIPRNSQHRSLRSITRKRHPVTRALLGAVFIWASWDKLFHPQQFSEIIRNYQILPELLVPAAALGLPWVEFICGVCLLSGRLAIGAALLIDIMLMVFIFALMFNFYRGIDINCGCFTTEAASPGSTLTTVVRDIALLGIGIMVLTEEIRRHNRGRTRGLR